MCLGRRERIKEKNVIKMMGAMVVGMSGSWVGSYRWKLKVR